MIVKQAANVLDLLEYFARVQRPATLSEVAADLGWPRSSTFNLLTTLAQRGFLYEPRPREGYYPTSRWSALVVRIGEGELLPASLCDTATELAIVTGETVAVVGPSGMSAVLLHVVESSSMVRFSAEPGLQWPIHATASGRALLAQYSARERDALLRKVDYAPYGDHPLADAAAVEARIAVESGQGWFEAHTGDLVGISVPLDLRERCLSLLVAGPAPRMRKRLPEIIPILCERRDGFVANVVHI